jgi:hypothetical protein
MGHFGLLVILRTLTLQDVAVETALLQVVGDVARARAGQGRLRCHQSVRASNVMIATD